MKWSSRISRQDQLIDYGTTASPSISERIKRFFGLLMVAGLLAYSAWLTGERIYDLGHDDGVNGGYEWGHEVGLQEGSELGCMVKPI